MARQIWAAPAGLCVGCEWTQPWCRLRSVRPPAARTQTWWRR